MIDRRTTLAGLLALAASPAAGQNRLTLKRLRYGGKRFEYLVRLAGGAKAPMLLCFGGGDANRQIVEYYDQVYTPDAFYGDHHVILPIGPARRRFFQFSDRDVRDFLDALTEAEPIEGRGLISGVSNGGRAAFRFAQAVPEAFRGIVTMPGAMGGRIVPAAWRDYAILMAYGGEDPRWEAETRKAMAALIGKVGALDILRLAGQGHVVGADYDTDPIYARLKALEAELGR